MTSEPDLWHILGPGAIGSLFGWQLDRSGFTVRFIGPRPEESGRLITLESDRGNETHAFLNDQGNRPIENLLVTVKAHQTEQALEAIRHRVVPGAIVLMLQNGMGTWDIATRLLPQTVCLQGTTTEGANRVDSNHIVHAGHGFTWIGANQPEHIEQAKNLVKSWQKLPMSVDYDPYLQQRLWQKLAINCAINPLTVLYDCPNGKLLEIPQAVTEMQAICEEAARVIDAVLGTGVDSGLFEVAREVTYKTADNISSMLQDYRRGLKTEVEFITGYLVSQAKIRNLETPINERILAEIRSLSG